jgi:hypothetical protein
MPAVAVTVHCPHCQNQFRATIQLPEPQDLRPGTFPTARVTCANPQCRKEFTVVVTGLAGGGR